MLQAGLDHGDSAVIGIEKENQYLTIARKRIEQPYSEFAVAEKK